MNPNEVQRLGSLTRNRGPALSDRVLHAAWARTHLRYVTTQEVLSHLKKHAEGVQILPKVTNQYYPVRI